MRVGDVLDGRLRPCCKPLPTTRRSPFRMTPSKKGASSFILLRSSNAERGSTPVFCTQKGSWLYRTAEPCIPMLWLLVFCLAGSGSSGNRCGGCLEPWRAPLRHRVQTAGRRVGYAMLRAVCCIINIGILDVHVIVPCSRETATNVSLVCCDNSTCYLPIKGVNMDRWCMNGAYKSVADVRIYGLAIKLTGA